MGRASQIVTENIAIDTSGIVAINAPNNSQLTRVYISGPSTFTAEIFSRAFTSTAIPITQIASGDGAKAQIKSSEQLHLTPGDSITVASTGVGGYHTTHIVTEVIDNYTVLTDQNYISTVVTGTLTLAIPSIEQNLYRVIAALSGTSNLASYLDTEGMTFVNQDPLPKSRASKDHTNIYVKLTTSGTYRISLTFVLPE